MSNLLWYEAVGSQSAIVKLSISVHFGNDIWNAWTSMLPVVYKTRWNALATP